MSETETDGRGGFPRPRYLTYPPLVASAHSSDRDFPVTMDHADEATPQRRPRQQLSCVQCRRRKVKCDHERPCKRCRIRGWDSQCTYPLHAPTGSTDLASPAASPRRASVARDWRTASPSIANRPPLARPGPSAYNSPSEPTDFATPETLSGDYETIYGFLPRRASQPAAPQRTISEPAPLATPTSASPSTFPRPPSVSDQNAGKPSTPASNLVYEPRPAEDHALYLANGETVYFGRSSAPWLISKVFPSLSPKTA